MNILGISAYFHDSAAVLVVDGKIIAAVEEERFSRKKHDSSFPKRSVQYCLAEAGLALEDLDFVCYYEKPFQTFARLMKTYMATAPFGFFSFRKAIHEWLGGKLFLKQKLRKELHKTSPGSKLRAKLLFGQHHQSHAASAFYPSPFEEAVVLCVDGVGEWATTSLWRGNGSQLTPIAQINFPHSLGLLYSAFTVFCGFKVNSGEYKLMGLAPYGEPIYVELIKRELIEFLSDGSFRLNLHYFNFSAGLTMTNTKFANLFGGPARIAEGPLTKREMDIAASIQKVLEEAVLALARRAKELTGSENLCLAGGVALNCVANGRLLKSNLFKEIFVQPASGDAGGALGAALLANYDYLGHARKAQQSDSLSGAYLGPLFSSSQIEVALRLVGVQFRKLKLEEAVEEAADLLADGNVIGWYQGRMEFGPRALGARSILADPRRTDMQSKINLKVKFREGFRPFAPSVLAEHASTQFELECESPYMLFTAQVNSALRRDELARDFRGAKGFAKLKVIPTYLPAITHVDMSARVQTVDVERSPLYHNLISRFYKKTGCPTVLNTSFNVRGEPIVCTPAEAIDCFLTTDIDALVIGQFVALKIDNLILVNNRSRVGEVLD